MSHYEFWQSRYREKRYARHLSQQELNKRIRDIFLNLLRVTPDAKVGLHPVNDESAAWMEKWTHVLEEMRLRHGPYPSGFDREILHSEPFPDFVSELAKKAARALSSLGLQRGNIFMKFGKRIHMEALYETGSLRVQPASYFYKEDHNGAVKDDELTIPLSFALSRNDMLKLVVNPQDVPPDAPEQRANIRFNFPSDYWLYCLTSSVEPRLFVDFNADSCVIIRNSSAFEERLHKAVEQYLPDSIMKKGPVTYIDPLLPSSTDIFVPLAKHFGYSYQSEYRFCWLPPTAVKELTHFDIQVGSLKEIAELVVL